MTEEKDAVHYQLSITAAQAGAFFFGLLMTLCLAFFFGMKTGAAAKRAPDAVSRLAAISDLPVPTVPAEEKESASSGRGASVRPTATEPPLGIDEAPSVKPPVRGEASAPPAHASAPKTREAPAPTVPAVASERAERTEESAPKPAPTAAKAARPEVAHAGAPRPLPESWFVQIVATQSAATADDVAKKLKAAGYASDVSPVPSKPGLFRVRIGPYEDRAAAEAAVARVEKGERWLKAKPMVLPASR